MHLRVVSNFWGADHANRGLPRFRAQKHDFAPDGSCLFHNWFGLRGLFFVDDLGVVLLRLREEFPVF